MMKLTVAVLAALCAGYALAECPNACSGNGECVSRHDYCQCYNGFIGADCSERICPFGLSFIDTPVGDLDHDGELNSGGNDVAPQWRSDGYFEQHPKQLYGAGTGTSEVNAQEGHFYMECSNAGICDRSSGQCQCFTGFEGAACNRTACASDCSGHGLCKSMKELAPTGYYYELWDADKTMKCECDGGWGGIDCSMRLCMTNDDPLTHVTTRVGYSANIAERGEEQELEFRCPYNGKIINPMARLIYTDAQFGDEYTTASFDFTSDLEAIKNALKGLPNQVLSDYAVDGIVKLQRLSNVDREVVDSERHYVLTVTFDESMGDVPALQIVPEYKCQGGAEVVSSTYIENINVEYIAEGPAEDIQFEIVWSSTTAFKYQVLDVNGVALGTQTADINAHTGAAVLSGAGDFTTEAEKVLIHFGGGSSALAARNGETVIVKIHTKPRVAVSSKTYSALNAMVRDGSPQVETVAPEYPYVTRTVGVTSAIVELWVDGEFRGWVDIPSSSGTLTYPGAMTDMDTVPAPYFAQTRFAQDAFTGAETQIAHTPADLKVVTYAPQGDSINVALQAYDGSDISDTDNALPTRSFRIVLKLIDVSTAQDTFTWKLAGDEKWAHEIEGVASYPIPPTGFNQLPGLTAYLARYVDDASRAELEKIQIDFTNGSDFDDRICTGDKQYYYIEVGSEGLNDSPVCSDRGMCDFGTGECKCFKGYAGIDCSEQNALAGGSFSSSGL